MFVLCIVLCTAHVLYSMGRYLYCPYKAGILSVPGSSKDRYLYCSYKAGILYGQVSLLSIQGWYLPSMDRSLYCSYKAGILYGQVSLLFLQGWYPLWTARYLYCSYKASWYPLCPWQLYDRRGFVFRNKSFALVKNKF